MPLLAAPRTRYQCLQNILKAKATSGRGGIIYYSLGNTCECKRISYMDLYTQASIYSQILRSLGPFRDGHPVLLHLDEQWDTIVWFWAILLANGVPVLSTSFSNIDDHRIKHIQALSNLFQSPICITRNTLLNLFDGANTLLQLYTIETLCHNAAQPNRDQPTPEPSLTRGPHSPNPDCIDYQEYRDVAMIMLTSGSTGNAKAVPLTHKQVLAAISGKASVRPLHRDRSFLNWISLDHVASLVEIHIQALWLGVDQIHVNTADIVSSPKSFLDLLSIHRVCRTFAPNFFLARLVSTVSLEPTRAIDADTWDLSNLQVVASGGEANDIKTCVTASLLFERYGACRNAITPGFGMTETCAGSIFNLNCPDYEVESGGNMACLGKCMNGIEMRITVGSRLAAPGEPGDLEVQGDVVFKGYYHNPKATADAFPSRDGWFRTGDEAYLDSNGNLCLVGRAKEVININGLKIIATDINSLLEKAIGRLVARFVVFPSRAAHTEQITICYVPLEWPHVAEDMAHIEDLASKACIASASAHPFVFSLRGSSLPQLPTSALGKISRSKMTCLFEAGKFEEDITSHKRKLAVCRREIKHSVQSLSVGTKAESFLIVDFAKTLGVAHDNIGPETQVFELGCTSMDLIRLKHRIYTRLGITVPIITIMKNPTARLLAAALNLEHGSEEPLARPEDPVVDYDPLVVFRPHGTKTPLWLIHPGVGEVLVFVGLAQHLADDDRPIYALRARGFEPGQARFSSITETVSTYVQSIKQKQPQGPYALAGYSYGAMLAFEVAKRLDALEEGMRGGSVHFLGSFNLPPHIKSRMRELNWNMCLLHLAQFLGLVSEEVVDDIWKAGFSAISCSDALTKVTHAADGMRMKELGLKDAALSRWADVAYGLQSMAMDYNPSGQVKNIDVFHAIPLKGVAASRKEWVSEHLSKWQNFCSTRPRLHAVEGAHYTMIGPEYVGGFAARLKEALKARGV